jgi:hypothetical protein
MGIEPPTISTEYNKFSAQGGAESGSLLTKHEVDPDLALLITAWPTLAQPIRAGILAMIRAAGG